MEGDSSLHRLCPPVWFSIAVVEEYVWSPVLKVAINEERRHGELTERVNTSLRSDNVNFHK